MRRKLLSLLLCATMVTTMVTGCGGGSKDGTSDSNSGSSSEGSSGGADITTDETVKLTLWGAEEDQDLLKELVGNFEKAYPDQKFDISIGVESESTAKDTVLTDIEAAADVYPFASDQLTDLVKAGALANLEETGAALSMAGKTLDDVKTANGTGASDAASIDGKMYAFPMAGDNGYFLYYDSSVISEEDTASWDTLLAAAAKAKKKVGFTFSSGWYNASFFYGAGFTTGLNDDGTTTIDWNGTSPDGYTGVDVVKAMQKIAADPSIQPMTSDNGSNLLSSGKLCATVSGSWDAKAAQKVFGKKNYAAIKLPTFDINGTAVQMSPVLGYKFVGVNAYSKNVGWATLLADFITNEESQATRFDQREIGPTNLKVLETDAVKKNVAVSALTSQSEFGVNQLVGGKFWDPTATFGEQIAKGKIGSDDDAIQKALDDLVAGVTAAVE